MSSAIPKIKSIVTSTIARLLDRKGLRFVFVPLLNYRVKSMGTDLKRIFFDGEDWIHETPHGFIAYQKPIVRLDGAQLDELTKFHFLWGYEPRMGDVVLDIGAGAGEEVLTFSRAVGELGKVVSVEAHPRTFRCLGKVVRYNQLKNVIPIQQMVAESSRSAAQIQDSQDYLSNRLVDSDGIPVSVTTIDAIREKLSLARVDFIKMNIEGAERLAIKGMTDTLKHTRVLCVSCHDFLADETSDDFFRTKTLVREFLLESGLRVVERTGGDLPPYVRDQLWAYNDHDSLRG
jgi:FkbM family methyltransferase